ncbi:chromosome partitioning protein ParB [Hydrogenophaga crassostreae]|uniref:Chromosome partitioning protein ParB n=1 Tax=Hydrogenophaga crassostreae TaxID=1763535 RepID=A0A162T774_9BURK|nr:ParB N-terminal domain-containing protein [Hydrogenophaga crassostreae]AOW13991.1 chromosome partitioning protein ParB [Hydrogenophaga crassostreae]OAD44044.1 chromosome partitioning protein ParB [Hydrogenophaga crassostreae]
MNALTDSETQALHAIPAPQVPAQPSQQMLLVPLSRLRPSRRNVRKTAGPCIKALAASIERVGLLQNLTVTLAADGALYEVVAGGRRFAALKLLAKKRRIAKDWDVPCLLVADGSARTASLTENVQREAMHPADQFEAFAALVAEGRPVEDIAADFGVTPLVVQRRLKLANVSARLMADYRADAISLDQLMALAATDDHAAQEAAFYDAPEWQRSPGALRQRLTEREIGADHALVRFVGLDAYTATGGGVRRDLFADDEATGTTLIDAALLERLVRDKLETLAEPVRAEGWAWVEAVPHLSPAERQAFQGAPRQRREPTARESRRMEVLQGRIARTDAALEEAYDADNEDNAETLHQRREALAAELEAVQSQLSGHAPEVRAMAGVIVTLNREGQPLMHRGLLREAEAKALRALDAARQRAANGQTPGDDGGDPDGSTTGDPPRSAEHLSDRLARRLSAHRTAALQIEIARHPQVALAALVHILVQQALQGGYRNALPLGLRLSLRDRLEDLAPDWPESPAVLALRELRQAWSEQLPQDPGNLFAKLLAMPQDELVQLLALCTAPAVDVVTPRATACQPGAELTLALTLDMATWWKPTADSYFQHVPKATILDAVAQFAPNEVPRLSKLKKAEIAQEAERLAEGSGWMPAVFGREAPRTVECTETETCDD